MGDVISDRHDNTLNILKSVKYSNEKTGLVSNSCKRQCKQVPSYESFCSIKLIGGLGNNKMHVA
jgi:hypothetical protein